MKLIERKFYLQQPINVMNTPDIKVITGIRGGIFLILKGVKILQQRLGVINF
ncbi:MAG: hypothetical protein MR239_02810 [Clostridiales bacterium]|nr:hypothetical protein [Clostridiales bacterium]MDY4655376.1 hypothetical protein [Eubacteriales bacterium]